MNNCNETNSKEYKVYLVPENLLTLNMPIPKPNNTETKDEFIQRCMSDKVMTSEYEQSQRYKICIFSWEVDKMGNKPKK